jgi:imidazolonepropionase-like amidohydrolase
MARWLAILPLLLGAVPEDGVLAIKNARIITVSGPDIEGGTVVIRAGRIEAVGKDVEIPWDARTIDASGKVLMPGLIEAHTFRGLDRPNERMASVPFVSAFDAVNPVDPYFEDALRQGITTLLVAPGNDTLIGGQACVMKPWGVTTERMLVAKNAFLKISLKPRAGMSRMAHVAALRRELDEAAEAEKAEKEKKEGPPSETAVKREPLARLLKGALPAIVYCPTASDALKAVELAETYKFRAVLVLGRDGWRAAEEIAKRKLDVVLAPELAYWETDEEKHEEVRRVGATPFAKAGVRFAFQTDGSPYGGAYLWYQAATAVKHGMSRADALRAITLGPAEILGLGARMGSIEKGKDANLALLTGDPLDAQTWVDRVLIDGKTAYERSKDERLKRVLPETKK